MTIQIYIHGCDHHKAKLEEPTRLELRADGKCDIKDCKHPAVWHGFLRTEENAKKG